MTYTVSRAVQEVKGTRSEVKDALAWVAEDAGRGDRRDVAAEPHHQREEGLARQADAAHQAIGDHGGTGHVARVLQHSEEDEHKGHQRHERQQHPDARDETVHEQSLDPAAAQTDRLQACAGPVGDGPGEQGIEPVLQRRCDGGRDLEDEPHDAEEDQRPRHRMRGDPVDLVRAAHPLLTGAGGASGDRVGDPGEPLVLALQVVGRGGQVARLRHCLGERFADRPGEVVESDAVTRIHHDDRAAEPLGEGEAVDLDARLAGQVGHGQRDDDAARGFAQLGHEVERTRQVGGIHGHDRDVWTLGGGRIEEQCSGEFLVRAERVQAVGTGKVDQRELRRGVGRAAAVAVLTLADLVARLEAPGTPADVDGGAGPVPGDGAQSGEAVEQRRLADVGGSGERDDRGSGDALATGFAAGGPDGGGLGIDAELAGDLVGAHAITSTGSCVSTAASTAIRPPATETMRPPAASRWTRRTCAPRRRPRLASRRAVVRSGCAPVSRRGTSIGAPARVIVSGTLDRLTSLGYYRQ
jgi:hypothetical protein